jgi:23S rRNA G2445 N2-methylase RlmL
LNRRHRENHLWKTALNCSFAYCLARAANIQRGEVVCDPLCGVGTIMNEVR